MNEHLPAAMLAAGRRRSDAIVAYTYQAEQICPDCTMDATVKTKTLKEFIRAGEFGASVEGWLDWLALTIGVDRKDEHSFDSDVFPKVVFDCQLSGNEKCDRCGGVL